MAISDWTPEARVELLPGRTVTVPGRGEFFLRDSGGDGPPVMLLHGWIASGDLNWAGCYAALTGAGYRVLAIDHRGHGRGLRPLVSFRLADCATDAAAVIRTLELGPTVVIGYSMGGAIAQLVARDHRDVVGGLILSGTAQHWREPALRRYWLSMGAFGLALALSPARLWTSGLRRAGFPEDGFSAWVVSELMRDSARDIAEAGRELGRFDSRPWLRPLAVPSAVVLTSRDDAVPPHKQRELAAALHAPIFEAPINHLEILTAAERYNPALLEAIAVVRPARREATTIAG